MYHEHDLCRSPTACTGKVCAVTKIRSSTKPHPVPAYTVLYSFVLATYVEDFFKAIAGNMYTPTLVQRSSLI